MKWGDYLDFYEQFLTYDESKTSGEQKYALCPLHKDTNASFTVNTETGAWYCHGCGRGGHYVEFVQWYFDVPLETAKKVVLQWNTKGTWKFPTEEYVEKCHESLMRRTLTLEEINSFGITEEILKKYQIGWDDIRVTFPIRSRTGKVINVRKYILPSKRTPGSNTAKVIGVKELNDCRFYPYTMFNECPEDEPLYIVEGEKDCLAAISQGLYAVTGTGGTTIPVLEMDMFKDRDVYIMTDSDVAGDKNADKYYLHLRRVAKSVARIKLPEKDFVDFWMRYHTVDFSDYIIQMNDSQINTAIVGTTSLTQSEYVENLNSWIQLPNMCVTGTDPMTYTIPSKLKVICGNPKCDHPCAIGSLRTPEVIEVEPRQLVYFVNSSDTVQHKYLQGIFGCTSIKAEPDEYVNVQKLLFQESASFVDGSEESSFEHRYGLFLYQDARLLPTAKYDFEACRVSDPKTQQNYYVIRKASLPMGNNEHAILTDEVVNYFKAISRGKTIHEVIQTHYDLWRAKLGIEGRADLFGALILTYLSVTEIKWKAGIIKGWLDTMVIGDTRTGKSQMAQRLVKTLEVGSYINGENARRTGVIGGVQKFGDSWVITWGAIPLNDRGLLVVDEASGLDISDIKELSATRSSGAVTINKIAKGEARARTRLIWLSNPRSGRNIDEFYWKAYGAFQEFIPVAEDQARYDMVISAAHSDVNIEDFEEIKEPENMDNIIHMFKTLVTFAWSTVVENITITTETRQSVQAAAQRLDRDFAGGPLVVGVAVHEKILRIACACAILRGDIENFKVIVTPQSIQDAEEFLRSTLSKDSFDYTGYIKESKRAQQEKVLNIAFIKTQLSLYPSLRVLLASNQFRGLQIREVLGIDQYEASKILSELLRRGLVKLTSSGAYSPDKMLIEITKQIGGE